MKKNAYLCSVKHEHLPIQEWRDALRRMQPYRTTRAVWLAVATSLIISGVMVVGAISPETSRIEPTFHTPYICVSNLLLMTILFLLNFWVLRRDVGWLRAIALPGSLLVGSAWTAGSFQVEHAVYGCTSNTLTLTLIANTSAAFTSYLISLLISNVSRIHSTLAENEHLQAENLRIQLGTLEQQVSPHFLFNSLNTLDGLIGTDDERAHGYLRRLSESFRYTLQQRDVVTLAEELEFTHAYIYMMQIRYGEALRVDEKISPALMGRRMPPISLQLLIENAIKHNVVSQRHPFSIVIESVGQGETAAIRVSNPLQPKADSEESAGIGLGNLRGRYNLLSGREIEITDDGKNFTVEIPLI